MRAAEARRILGFSPNFRPSRSQIKEAYRRKALESHPDRFPLEEKPHAESMFKMISEAYSHLRADSSRERSFEATAVRVVRTGVPRSTGYGKANRVLVTAPFFFLIVGTVSFGCWNAVRAYERQKEECPSQHPFLP